MMSHYLPCIERDLSANCNPIHYFDAVMRGTDPAHESCRIYRTVLLKDPNIPEKDFFNFKGIENDLVGSYQGYVMKKIGGILSNSLHKDVHKPGETVEAFYKSLLKPRNEPSIEYGLPQHIDAALNLTTSMKKNYLTTFRTKKFSTKVVNLNAVKNVLQLYRLRDKKSYEGINETVLLMGPSFTISSLHIEDYCFASINQILYGDAGKIWIVIDPAYNKQLEDAVKIAIGLPVNSCFILRTKEYSVTLEFLVKNNIPYRLILQGVGEMVVVGSGVYHQVLNIDRNIAVAINVITETHCEPIYEFEACTHDGGNPNAPHKKLHGQDLRSEFPNLYGEMASFLLAKMQSLTPADKEDHLDIYKLLLEKLHKTDFPTDTPSTSANSRKRASPSEDCRTEALKIMTPVHPDKTGCKDMYLCECKSTVRKDKVKSHYQEVHQKIPRPSASKTTECQYCKFTILQSSLKKHIAKKHPDQ